MTFTITKTHVLIILMVILIVINSFSLWRDIRVTKPYENPQIEIKEKEIEKQKKKTSKIKKRVNEKKRNIKNINVPSDNGKLDSMFESSPNAQRLFNQGF